MTEKTRGHGNKSAIMETIKLINDSNGLAKKLIETKRHMSDKDTIMSLRLMAQALKREASTSTVPEGRSRVPMPNVMADRVDPLLVKELREIAERDPKIARYLVYMLELEPDSRHSTELNSLIEDIKRAYPRVDYGFIMNTKPRGLLNAMLSAISSIE